MINQPVSMYLLRKVFKYSYRDYFSRVILPCFLFSVVAPIIPIMIHLIMKESFGRLLLVCIVSVIISLIFVYSIIMTKSEKMFIKVIIDRYIQLGQKKNN